MAKNETFQSSISSVVPSPQGVVPSPQGVVPSPQMITVGISKKEMEDFISKNIGDIKKVIDVLNSHTEVLPIILREIARQCTDTKLLEEIYQKYPDDTIKGLNHIYENNYPLFHAFWRCNVNIIKGFQKCGADFSLRNGKGECIPEVIRKKKLDVAVETELLNIYNEQIKKSGALNNREEFIVITDLYDPLGLRSITNYEVLCIELNRLRTIKEIVFKDPVTNIITSADYESLLKFILRRCIIENRNNEFTQLMKCHGDEIVKIVNMTIEGELTPLALAILHRRVLITFVLLKIGADKMIKVKWSFSRYGRPHVKKITLMEMCEIVCRMPQYVDILERMRKILC
jgi:hypothetical protein